jgi:hypothetical protein
VLQRLAVATGGDPTYLIDLGDRYYQAGDKKKALETWARIKSWCRTRRARRTSSARCTSITTWPRRPSPRCARPRRSIRPACASRRRWRSRSSARPLGGVPAAALRRGACDLGGAAQERRRRQPRARVAHAHRQPVGPAEGAAEPGRAAEAALRPDPPDLEAGRLLAEVQRKLGKLPDAEATLRRVTTLDPGDEASLLALERVLVQQQNLTGAIASCRSSSTQRQARPRILPAHGPVRGRALPRRRRHQVRREGGRALARGRAATRSSATCTESARTSRTPSRVSPGDQPERPALPRVLRSRRAAPAPTGESRRPIACSAASCAPPARRRARRARGAHVMQVNLGKNDLDVARARAAPRSRSATRRSRSIAGCSSSCTGR